VEIFFEERTAESPFVERIWRSQSAAAGPFISTAGTHWMMVVTNYEGNTTLTVRGPETRATHAFCPEHGAADSEFFGIVFKLGTFMPCLPPAHVMDRQDATLTNASSQRFWLDGSAWQFPTFDNADIFINRLVRDEQIVHDSVVDAVLQGRPQELSVRSLQARFSHATGLNQTIVRQIERAHHAAALLQSGVSILDTMYEAGYFDQSHLSRSLKRYLGQTPAEIARTAQAHAEIVREVQPI
jgi:hypothetical protein